MATGVGKGRKVAAVVLAGGRGERLGGVIKAQLKVGGVRLLDRVLARLEGCAPILVASGPHDVDALELPLHVRAVPDLPADYAGPLAGFAAAVAAIGDSAELMVAVAVDTPFLPNDYVEQLVAGLGNAPAAIASYAGQPYPTNSIWRLDRFRGLPGAVLAGSAPRSLRRLAAQAGGIELAWPIAVEGDPFANVNTPAEHEAMELRAGFSKGF